MSLEMVTPSATDVDDPMDLSALRLTDGKASKELHVVHKDR
jgi:hypothetical protein